MASGQGNDDGNCNGNNNQDSKNGNQTAVMNMAMEMVMAMEMATATAMITPSNNITYGMTPSSKHHNGNRESIDGIRVMALWQQLLVPSEW